MSSTVHEWSLPLLIEASLHLLDIHMKRIGVFLRKTNTLVLGQRSYVSLMDSLIQSSSAFRTPHCYGQFVLSMGKIKKSLIECFHSRGQHLCKFIGTKESVCIRKEFNSHRTGLGHQHGRRFIVLGHQYGHRDVMWKHSIYFKFNPFNTNTFYAPLRVCINGFWLQCIWRPNLLILY